MEIKTIVDRLDNAKSFDDKVNAALADGWRMVKREVLMSPSQPNTGSTFFYTMLYAEMEKP